MPRYSPMIGYLLAWQLLLPLLCFFFSASWYIPAVTAILFIVLLASKDWERNTYSFYSAVLVAIASCVLVAVSLAGLSHAPADAVSVLWVYAMVAFTATSPYPLIIRMPLIIYSLMYIFMIPRGASMMIVVPAALVFSAVMCCLAVRWSARTKALTTAIGPPEPPYSFSLAAAIVLAVVINLCLSVTGCFTASKLPALTSFALLTALCIWLLCAGDWKKNLLAVTALALMITLHLLTAIAALTGISNLSLVIFALSVAPVMFHTTAPVFRGMRIVITLFAVYSALNKHTMIAALSHSPLPVSQQHAIIIGIDAVVALTLFAMAIHWKNNEHKTGRI